ncbi:hypothetical protein U9M48_004039 [Paspalum notatum var. saurae]|uniref:Uncharacterized protein n=1 Tax=Paspalum notatum var. saurae TaxID=547442 RepID=A0AAQ3SEI4_PASNO
MNLRFRIVMNQEKIRRSDAAVAGAASPWPARPLLPPADATAPLPGGGSSPACAAFALEKARRRRDKRGAVFAVEKGVSHRLGSIPEGFLWDVLGASFARAQERTMKALETSTDQQQDQRGVQVKMEAQFYSETTFSAFSTSLY